MGGGGNLKAILSGDRARLSGVNRPFVDLVRNKEFCDNGETERWPPPPPLSLEESVGGEVARGVMDLLESWSSKSSWSRGVRGLGIPGT